MKTYRPSAREFTLSAIITESKLIDIKIINCAWVSEEKGGLGQNIKTF